MPLSNEDNLRLNVLSAQPVKVIRINESTMLLTALTDKGEASIALCPNQRHDVYLREVRNFLSEKFLGMPGGYPRHLGRWTRMGDNQNSLDKMLLLGEPEAIVALAHSSEVTAEHARYAWWAVQSPEIARSLLRSQNVVDSALGPELAKFLLEFLPFEAKAMDVVDGVALCLQGALISDESKLALWERAKRKNPYYVGFLVACPQSIPHTETAHANYEATLSNLNQELCDENPYAQAYAHFLSADGQKWLKLLLQTLKKPTEPNVVIAIFMAIDQYPRLDLGIGEHRGVRDIRRAITTADTLCTGSGAAAQLFGIGGKLETQQLQQFKSVLVLAQLGENTLNDIFDGRDATGTVMRKHLEPLTAQINTLIKPLIT
jgi:hypothetical protein